MKRPSPSDADEQYSERPPKRIRIQRHAVRYKQPHADDAVAGAQDEEFFQSQLLRAISLALSAVGFTGATPEALEAFRAETEEYIFHFTSLISTAMLSSRRTKATPQDFILALAATGQHSSQLTPHVDLPAPPSITQPPLTLSDPEPPPPPSLEAVLGPQLSGAAEKSRRAFVPRHLPDLPSRHTWQSTPTYSTRETDPRRIRERAAAEGVLAEKALRRLTAARSKGVVRAQEGDGMPRSEEQRRNEAVWRETLAAVREADEEARRSFEMENPEWYGGRDAEGDWNLVKPGEAGGDMEIDGAAVADPLQNGMVVNYERRYWMQAARANA